MNYKKSTIKVFEFVNKVKDIKRKKKSSAVPVQKIRLDEQTRNDFELEHDTKLNDPYIYLDPDDSFRNRSFLLAYALSNQIHIKKSKYNPGSTETKAILEHELTHVQQYSEGRDNESVDELELEASLNEARHLRNGEEVKYIEYAPGKYCETTPSEYKRFLADIANNFETKVWDKINRLSEEKQLKFIIELEEWSNRYYSDKFFDVDRWY